MLKRSQSVIAVALTLLLSAAGCSRQGRSGGERVEWPCMGTVAALQSRGSPAAADAVQAAFAEVGRLLNAHDPTSELNRLAPLADDAVLARCDPSVRPCYAAAFALAKATGRAFDPRWRGAGTLDLGAIAKGFALDVAYGRLGTNAVDGLLLDLGGNLRASAGSWCVGVRSPDDRIAATVMLRPGEALATSAEYFRGKHIFDARTHRPVSNEVASVTVLADSAMLADGLSTALFVLGLKAGRAFLDAAHPQVWAYFQLVGAGAVEHVPRGAESRFKGGL